MPMQAFEFDGRVYQADDAGDGLKTRFGGEAGAVAAERPAAVAHRRRVSGPCIKYLIDTEILLEEPSL